MHPSKTSLGALDSFILKIYFIEAALQGLLGTAMGMTLGLLVAFAVSLHAYRGYVAAHFPGQDVLGSLAVAFVVGSIIAVAAAIAPAQWAAKKEPVEAMRAEE